MNDDELTEAERTKLDTWNTLTPPAGFAERVLAARDAEVTRPAPRKRWPFIAAGVAAAAAAVTLFVATRAPDHSAHGELVAADRTTRTLGDRAVVVAEPSASLSWQIDRSGDAVIDQREGDVFYRVEHGGTFVVHTPTTDVHVTGTCFRIEVTPMNKQMILSAAAGAAIASAVIVTVYEGHVLADSRHGEHTQLAAGDRATVSPDGHATIASTAHAAPAADAWNLDDKTATREQLIARAQSQQAEIVKLREHVADLETNGAGRRGHSNEAEPGRAWYDPSPEKLAEWAGECHVRVDEPGLDRWRPNDSLGDNKRGLEPGELAVYNEVVAEVQKGWKQLVRSLYIETTGDTAGADSLSTEAMRREIEEKGAPEEGENVLQHISAEKAGLAQPPADPSKLSPFERMFRAYLSLGDQTEAALAKRLGAERAKAIRGADGWDSHSDMSGCPKK